MNQEKLYHLFDQSTAAIVIFNTQEGIQYANQPFLQLLGYEKYHLRGEPFSSLIPSSLHPGFELFIQSKKKSFYQSHVHLQKSDNSFLHADINIQRLTKQDSIPATYVVTIYPIHAEQLTANEHRKVNEVLFSETESLLSLLEKETNVPLSTLTSLVDRLLEQQPRSDQTPFLESILHSSHQLKRVIKEILLYADLVQGRIRPKLQAFNLYDILKELQDIYYALAQEKDIDFKVLTDEDIPTVLVGDASLIRQMLENLLTHLFAFTSKRTVKLQVLLESKVASAIIIKLSFIDRGISPERLLLLKQAFFGTSSKTPQEWTMVELEIVNRLAKQLGGSISLDDFPLNYLSLHLSLPLGLVEDTPDRKKSNLPVEFTQSSHPLQGLRVLYVEDVIPNHFLMEGLCSIWQVNLDTALNGQEALDKVQYNSYDIVLMDLQMPIMNGYEASQRIREASFLKNSAVPIIAVSGSVSDDTLIQIKKYGMNDLIPKPIKPDELFQKLLGFSSS